MTRSLGFKFAVIFVLGLGLFIPLAMIRGIVTERQRHRDQVLQEIARSSSQPQTVTGPVLVVPYRKTERQWKTNPMSSERYQETSERRGRLYFLPERLVIDGTVAIEMRRRGIYEARLYHSRSEFSGEFAVPARFGVTENLDDYRFEPAFLAVGISDIRGIENDLRLRLGDRELGFEPGGGDSLLASGVHAPIPADPSIDGRRIEFAFSLALQGTSSLGVTPVGRDTRVQWSSEWPHPSFVGEFLPVEREVGSHGFTARWQTSFFATNLESALADCTGSGSCDAFRSRQFGVGFIDPVDHYLKSERAVKYAVLFIALIFAGFFLFEVLGRLAVHPVQYGLVGLALAVFYLLLLSLSEHVGFGPAYLISASSSLALIGFYVSHVLRGWQRGGGLSAALAALYALLYGLLIAEDYALLMGSLLIFGLLAGVMILTRSLDWYALSRPAAASGRSAPEPTS